MSRDGFEDPPRIDDEGPDALRRLVRARREGPSAADIAKMSERLTATGVLGAGSSVAVRAERPLALYKIAGVALLAAGGLLLTWQAMRTPAAPPGTVAESASAPHPSAGTEAEPGSAAHPVIEGVSVEELPSAPPLPARRTDATSPATVAKPAARVPSGGAAPSAPELELVQRAQAALASDPRRALALTAEHERAFPSGEFIQEREAIAVEALAHLGQKAEAVRRARALLDRYPRTPYAPQIEILVGERP